jgi:hypothetical protein
VTTEAYRKENTTIEWDDGAKIGNENNYFKLKSSHRCMEHDI